MVALDSVRYLYRVDKDDKITWVNAAWLAFAQENNALELTESRVVGRCLWEFVADKATCDEYRRVHAHLRGKKKVAVIPFRCDSPNLRRDMRLTISGNASDESLDCESVIVQAMPHRYISVLDPGRSRAESFLTMCSCCKRVLVEPDGWLDVAIFSQRLRSRARTTWPHTRQTLCPKCRELLGSSLN